MSYEYVKPLGPNDKIAQQYNAWRATNDGEVVWLHFCAFTEEAIQTGKLKFSASMVCERIRWEIFLNYKGDGPKINNNYKAMLSREWLRRHPHHRDFFETRARTSVNNNSTATWSAANGHV